MEMGRIIAIAALAATLAGCNEEERARRNLLVEQQLPDGCAIHDLGDFYTKDRERVPVVMVRCKGATDSTAISWGVQNGKIHQRRFGVVFNPTHRPD
jgi:hypothetical protein